MHNRLAQSKNLKFPVYLKGNSLDIQRLRAFGNLPIIVANVTGIKTLLDPKTRSWDGLSVPFLEFLLYVHTPRGNDTDNIYGLWAYVNIIDRDACDDSWQKCIVDTQRVSTINEDLDFFCNPAFRWAVSVTTFLELDYDHFVGPISTTLTMIQEDGSVPQMPPGSQREGDPTGNWFIVLPPGPCDYEAWQRRSHPDIMHVSLATFGAVIHTMSLLGCKNVMLDKVAVPRAERRQAQRAGLPETVTYDLVLKPHPRSRYAADPDAVPTHHKKQHLCRGHFAHYDEEHKLFGKYVGKFWIPPHVKGSSEIGIVRKDYIVP
jgi:hypothetical protein